MPTYAGIDIGTLTLRLLIARVLDGRLRELDSDRRIVRLGEGLQPSRRLQPAPMARAIDTIVEWKPKIERSGAREVVAVATSAVRDAVNREEFLGELKRRSGWDVAVLSGEEEARLSLLGIRSGLPPDVTRYVALDIGGGSTEFIKATPDRPPVMVSINEGVVRLTEECLRRDPPTPDEVAAARTRIRAHLNTVKEKLGSVVGFRLVGTAGTITTLAAMDQQMETYAPKRIHNYRLSWDAVRRLLGDLASRTHAQRRELKGLEPGREDLMMAGTLILLECMERFGFVECLVSDYGLREGVLIDHWQKSRE
jgi:exopolyphosphatase/guanosine-5'-triphosphate,3'-diphosphate pyrophosphatase